MGSNRVIRSSSSVGVAVIRVLVGLCGVWLLTDPAVAHAGSLRLSDDPVTVPQWLVVSTGGGVVGASFLITSFVTDHETIRSVTDQWVSMPAWLANRSVSSAAGLASVVVLVVVVASGLVGTQSELSNFAILFVWVGWWAGYTISVYLLGNTWPTLNPWRTLASVVANWVPTERSVPQWLGVWPGVGGLLGLVWLEVISPVATSPRLLASVILVYSLLTVAGGAVYGAEWFRRVDPVSRIFRAYGRVAPFQRVASRIGLTVPGSALTGGNVERGEPVFIVAVLWVTTYDGLVSTPVWRDAAQWIVATAPIPPVVVYAVVMCGGFVAFLLVYRTGARYARRTGRTYVDSQVIEQRFARSLLPIAASYHFAHYLGYFLGLLPALAVAVTQPFGGPVTPQRLLLPSWFGQLQLVFILCGHLLAVWVAHTTAFDLFTGRLQSIRSQYPFVLIMIAYTVTSMWIVMQPYTQPPFVS